MRIIMAALIRRTVLASLPLLLSACLYSFEPLLDEKNSTLGDGSADVRAFNEASHNAYGDDFVVSEIILPFYEKATARGDLSVIRVAQLDNGMLLIQQELREDCDPGPCYVYYGARMLETWWPDICRVDTQGDEAQAALLSAATDHGVTLTLENAFKNIAVGFMDGPRDNQLSFLRAQFTEGQLKCEKDDDGLTAFHGAAAMGSPSDIAALINAESDVNVRDAQGWTPMHWAAQQNSPENIAILLSAGADVDARAKDGSTPLHGAAMYGSLKAIEALLEAGADASAQIGPGRPYAGATPLHLAASRGNSEAIPPLLAAGATVNARDEDGEAPLHHAAQSSPATITLLLASGADVDARDRIGRTPIYRALLAQSPANIKLLLEAGADVNVQSEYGDTPLHWAARSRSQADIAVLVEAGADVHVRDKLGRTPVHEAARVGSPANVEALLDAGADGSLVDNDGKTPFDLARENERHAFEDTEAYTRLEKARHK